MASRTFLYLTAVTMTVIFPSQCQNVSNLEKTGSKIYAKFITNYEKNSASTNTIRYTPPCGRMLATITDQIAEVYMPETDLFYIINKTIKNDCFTDAIREFSKLEKRTLITMIPAVRISKLHHIIYHRPTTYLLLGINPSLMVKPLIEFSKLAGTWNPKGLYISIAESKEEAVNIMMKLSKNFAYKVVVLVIHNNTLDTTEAYTWRPYYPYNYCGPPTIENIIRLGKFTKELQFQRETEILPGIIPKIFGNCSLKVGFNVWEPLIHVREEPMQDSGLEVNLIESICKRIGVRVIPTYQSLVFRDNRSEAWAGSYIPMPFDIETYDITMPYIQDNLLWFIPYSEEFSLVGLLDKVPFSLWALSAFVMIIVAASLMAFGEQHWILWVWGSFLEQVDGNVPNKLRGIWASWLLLSLHLTAIYRTLLITSLTNPLGGNEITSQKELLESGMPLSFIIEGEVWFDKEDEEHRKILERYLLCETVEKCYKEIPTGKALFTNRMYVRYLTSQKMDMSLIAEKVRELPASMTYKVGMIYSKSHPMLPSFNYILLLTLEAGLIEYLLKELEDKQTKTNMRRIEFTVERPLTIAQVSSVFQLQTIGLSIATVFFAYEIFRHSWQPKFLNYIKRVTSH